jgi:hypothetical protein
MDKGYSRILAVLLAAAVTGCSGSAIPPVTPPTSSSSGEDVGVMHPSKYIYVADRSRERLLVYPAFVQDPKPIRILGFKQGIVEIGGVTTDEFGNVYVANGLGLDVLEFNSGATMLVQKYTQALNHPVTVAVDHKKLYVADQDDHYPYGVNSSIVEYPKGKTKPNYIVLDPDVISHPIHAIAMDSRGTVWASTSQSGDIWPPPAGGCSQPPVDTVYNFVLPTLIMYVALTQNTQVSGLAIDRGVIYASDYCSKLDKYTYFAWHNLPPVPDSEDTPMYLTTSSDHLVVIPFAGSHAGVNGFVRVVSESTGVTYTIKAGLRGPIGAAAGP